MIDENTTEGALLRSLNNSRASAEALQQEWLEIERFNDHRIDFAKLTYEVRSGLVREIDQLAWTLDAIVSAIGSPWSSGLHRLFVNLDEAKVRLSREGQPET